MKLFPALTPLELVAIDILGNLEVAQRNSKYLLVKSDRFWKLVRTVLLMAITPEYVIKASVTHLIMANGSPRLLSSNSGNRFTLKMF